MSDFTLVQSPGIKHISSLPLFGSGLFFLCRNKNSQSHVDILHRPGGAQQPEEPDTEGTVQAIRRIVTHGFEKLSARLDEIYALARLMKENG